MSARKAPGARKSRGVRKAPGARANAGRRAPERATFPCVRCGAPLKRVKRPTRREIACPRCRFLIFDYPRPCAGVVLLKDDRVLVLRRAHLPKRGFLDLPGGFLEANESIEAGARRELLEETGLEVGPMDSLGIYWDRYFLRGFGPFPTINFYWIGRWRSGEPRAMDDAASAEWRPLATLGRPADRLAWPHMPDVLRDARAWAKGAGPAPEKRRATRKSGLKL